MIAVKDLVKRRGSRVVLAGVSLAVEEGSITTVVGGSGSGKTTLLRCMVGLEPFDEGEVHAGEHRLVRGKTSPGRLRALRREVGIVFQDYGLFGHMTALANVAEAPAHVLGLPEGEATALARRILDRVGLAARAHAFPRELSGGEKQRVALARALAMSPRGLLLDEPTSALDPAKKREVVELLRGVAAEGTTVVVVTHEPEFFRGVVGRTVVLEDGRVVHDG